MFTNLLPQRSGERARQRYHGWVFSMILTVLVGLFTVQPFVQAEESLQLVSGNTSFSVATRQANVPANVIVTFRKQAAVNVTITIRRSDFQNQRPLRFSFDLTSPFFRDGRQLSFKPTPAIVIETLPFKRDVFFSHANQSEYSFVVTLAGKRIGRRLLVVTAQEWLWDNFTESDVIDGVADPPLGPSFQVPVDGRPAAIAVLVYQSPQSDISKIFTFITIAGVAMNMLAYAVRLHTAVIKHHLLHPFPIGIGLICQCIIMPIIAYLIGLALDLPSYLKYALLALACSPGGGQSNFVTILLNGDIHMSVLMTSFSNFLSIGFMPLWLLTLGDELLKPDFSGHPNSIPYGYLIGLGLLYSVPAVVGGVYRHFVNENTSLRTSLWIRLVGVIVVAVGIGGLAYNCIAIDTFDYMFEDWKSVVATCILCQCSYIISFLLAFLGRRSAQARLTIAIEAGFQNTITGQLIGQTMFIFPESVYIQTMSLLYFINITIVSLIALFVTIYCGLHRGPDGEPLAVEIGYDTSPEVIDEYSISKLGELTTRKSSSDLASVKDNLGFSTSGSFASLSDVW